MKVEELQIGSLVLIDKDVAKEYSYGSKCCRLFSIQKIEYNDSVSAYSNIEGISIGYCGVCDLSPIEITVDWLLLFGFEKFSEEVYYLEDDTLGYFEYITSEGLYFNSTNSTYIKHVHEFQQLYRLINKKPIVIDAQKLGSLVGENKYLYY